MEFLVFLEESELKRKTKKRKNYLHGRAPNKQKKNKEILLGFILNSTTNYTRKTNKKEAGSIFVFSQSFSNTQEESEKINLAWIIQMKNCGHRQLK